MEYKLVYFMFSFMVSPVLNMGVLTDKQANIVKESFPNLQQSLRFLSNYSDISIRCSKDIKEAILQLQKGSQWALTSKYFVVIRDTSLYCVKIKTIYDISEQTSI